MSGFTFGGGAQPSGFGTAATSAPAFSGFGSSATPSTGFGFGTGTSTAPAAGFGFGAATTTTASTGFGGFGGFGTTSTAPTGFGFGTAPATTSSGGFGFGGFGATTTTASTGFGGFGGFGTTTTAPTGFGGFGTGLGAGSTGLFNKPFGTTTVTGTQPQQQPATDQSAEELNKIAQAVSLPQIFGDERDAVIAKWNQIQALWGTGKGYYNQNQFVEFKPTNPFCRFKAVGYNCMPQGRNEDGLISIIIKQPVDAVKSNQQLALDTLHRILGNKPQHTVCAEAVNPIPDNKTELVVYVVERPAMGPAKRCSATDLFTALTSMGMKPQVTSQLTAESITKKALSKEELKQYLDTPPAGINPLLWQQAILDNPDPERLIPVPMIGFKELHTRLKCQEQQTKLHQQRLDLIAQDLSEFQNKQSNMLAKQEEFKRKHLELSHRVLQVIVKQEILRKQGFAIQVDEEQLRVQLEALQTELNHPTQFKGRLNELMSQIRMQNHLTSSRSDVNYQMEPSVQTEIKTLLKQQQEGLQHLIDIIKDDTQDMNLIDQGLAEASASRR